MGDDPVITSTIEQIGDVWRVHVAVAWLGQRKAWHKDFASEAEAREALTSHLEKLTRHAPKAWAQE